MCLVDRRSYRLYNRAAEDIAKELDVVEFLRNQFIDRAQRRLTFTKSERVLLRNQYHPFVLDKKRVNMKREEESDADLFELSDTKSLYSEKLL